jgi:hypothetical protein
LRIAAHSDDVNAVSFVDENTHILASGGDDGLCKVNLIPHLIGFLKIRLPVPTVFILIPVPVVIFEKLIPIQFDICAWLES